MGGLFSLFYINDELTISSSSISLWTTTKKKPIFTQPLAHGFNEVVSSTEGLLKTPRWVTALASLRYSDILASGNTGRAFKHYLN